MRTFFALLWSLVVACLVAADPDYNERLVLEPLTPELLLASFNFRGNASLQSFEQQHFRFIPRSLGQILQHAKTRELHLRFSTGRWDAESWGARPWRGQKEGGTGVELWAWVEADTEEEAFARWITLNHALSGLFCASLNFIDSTRTTRPVKTFEPAGHHSESAMTKLHLLHGTLPREVVCTENLTPFLKLLPCKGKAGISTLLDGHKLFDASWQTMSIDIRPVCGIGRHECYIEMEQTVDMVLDIERSKRPRDNPIPRPIPEEDLVCDRSKTYEDPNACYPLDVSSSQSWSLSEVFGRPIKGSCLATDATGNPSESVCLNVPYEREVSVSGNAIETKKPSGQTRCFTLHESEAFELTLPQQTLAPNARPEPLLYASRSITGHGQERGGVQTLLTNPSPSTAISFIYFESLPWFMKPYLHTLTARISTSAAPDPNIIQSMYYRPALDRRRGTQLECLLTVPPAATVVLSYDFDKAILRYTEYPPDANRGFDVAPAVIRILPPPPPPTNPFPPSTNSPLHEQEPIFLRTTSLLLPLPTPDFSMPYNVIILTSTVMALAFGSVFTMLVRRFVGADEVHGYDFAVVRDRIRGRVMRLRERVLGEGGKRKIL